MPTFSANLSFLWPELPPLARFAAAARADFRQVEFLFPQELDAVELARALTGAGLELVLFDVWPGDRRGGERGCLSLPGKEEVLARRVEEALDLATRLGTRRLNLLGGMLPPELDPRQARDTAIANLNRLAPLAAEAGVSLLLENINPAAAPGYAFPTVASAAVIVNAVAHPAVGLQLDQYHVSMVGGDPLAEFTQHASSVRHIQIADAPGRHQPGTGQVALPAFLYGLDEAGYDGCVGLEYEPLGTPEAALAWLTSL